MIDGKDFTIEPGYIMTHESCRPPELKFQRPEGAEATRDAEETLHPTVGGDCIVRQNSWGAFLVEQP